MVLLKNTWEALSKLDSEMRTRQKQLKKRSLQVVNEHFEIVFPRCPWVNDVIDR
jgi:hypothetical protein